MHNVHYYSLDSLLACLLAGNGNKTESTKGEKKANSTQLKTQHREWLCRCVLMVFIVGIRLDRSFSHLAFSPSSIAVSCISNSRSELLISAARAAAEYPIYQSGKNKKIFQFPLQFSFTLNTFVNSEIGSEKKSFRLLCQALIEEFRAS